MNKPYTAVVVFHDVSKEKQAEIESEKISAHMQQGKKLESLGMLAGRVAHDFNNLLTPIRGSSELIEHLSPENERISILAQKILLASEKAADLCHQMLAHAGSTLISMEPINLSEEVSQLNSLFKSSLSMEVEYKQELPTDLPLIDADINEIRQIILNLLINASESIDGSGEVLLKTGVTTLKSKDTRLLMPTSDLQPGNYVFLEVSDTGCGMDEETLQNLFNPFFTTKIGGRGLGLSAVLGIVKQHSAGLRVKSEPGKGSKFELFFPVSTNKSKPEIIQSSSLQNQFSGQILLVDDDPEVHEIGKEILNMLGFDVLAATNGQEALDIFREKEDQLKCIVLDVLMPVMNGEQAFAEIR